MNWQLPRMHFISSSSAGTVQRIIPFLPYKRYKQMYQKRSNIYWEQTTRWWFLVCYNSIFTYLLYGFLQPLITKLLYCFRLGTWGVCFTYAAFFSMKGLVTAGRTYGNSMSIRKACQFLLSKQLNSGGWGESHLSNETQVINFFL
jgi:phosphoribosylpyrophosphate synthetase